MDLLSGYRIELKKMELGEHRFEYVMGDDFFGALADAEVKHGRVEGKVSVTAHTQGYEVCYEVKGVIEVPCDRCLDPMELSVKGKDHISLPAEQEEVDVAWLLYEQVALAIPVMHVHKEGECNEEMMKKLEEHRVSENGGGTMAEALSAALKKK